MPQTISEFPRGLLSLLGLRDFGRTPQELADQVVSVVDVRELFLQNRIETLISDDTAPALGSRVYNAGDLVNPVPPGEFWFVWHYRLTATPGAGTAVTLQPSIRLQDAQQAFVLPYAITGAAGNPPYLVPSGFNRWWVGPGSLFQYNIAAITGAPGTIRGVAQVTKLRV